MLRKIDWHSIAMIFYWIFILIWIFFVLSFFSAPGGVLGGLISLVLSQITPKYVTVFMNTFSLVGAYVVTRLLLSFRISWKTAQAEAYGVLWVIWVALTVMALLGARCDIYVFCADDASSSQSECEIDWDRQGFHCR